METPAPTASAFAATGSSITVTLTNLAPPAGGSVLLSDLSTGGPSPAAIGAPEPVATMPLPAGLAGWALARRHA